MELRTSGKGNSYREVIRRIAGILAFVFTFVAIVASTHHHGTMVKLAHTVITGTISVTNSGSATQSTSVSPKANPISFNATDCVLCDWMATPVQSASAVAFALFIALSTVASLLLVVRLAALCAVPAPRRGLRAPPAFAHA